ncbi:vesicle transport protein SEC20-like isoform X2 [Acanthaster planci]|uniref:Vesicle transport protein SEC20-like isoform X2 n=1 Tax=Acanthaster planci TaxID=133434 RepID=A0A8B7YEV3_ACAPL|nr:vesicle transport protein SEC20-like isoform X2 [Acanthaster planci]XP_022091774.1 vesicle transport protein SEC20-like isoform X2 [Acanthaster planci]XP_022091775.1 vesicle transport protein SEC20-like isoform X2 [Acanthaster planci]
MAADITDARNVAKEIIAYDLKINGLIQDIRSNCHSLQDMNLVNQKIEEQMKRTQNRIQDLERIANEQDKETDRLDILKDVENFRKQLSSTQTSVRKAKLSCKMAIDRQERASLLQGGTDPDLRKRMNKESLAKTAGSITDNLMSLNRMMAANVTQSTLTNQVLEKSSATLSDTHEEFKGMGGVIQTSRSLLTKYNRRELTDRLLIFLGVALFLATVLYILKKRIF